MYLPVDRAFLRGTEEDHSDLDYDILRMDVKKAINDEKEHWKIRGDEIVIWFDEEDIKVMENLQQLLKNR